MGAGHWYKTNTREHAIISMPFEEDDVDGFQTGLNWDDMKHNVLSALTASFTQCSEWLGRDLHVIAENTFYFIALADNGNGDAQLIYGVRDDIENQAFALSRLSQNANAFFKRLSEFHDLRTATSAWTSAPLFPAAF